MTEVFELKSRNQWLRRRIVTLLRQIVRTMFGDIVNRRIIDYVFAMTSPSQVADYLRTFKYVQNCLNFISSCCNYFYIHTYATPRSDLSEPLSSLNLSSNHSFVSICIHLFPTITIPSILFGIHYYPIFPSISSQFFKYFCLPDQLFTYFSAYNSIFPLYTFQGNSFPLVACYSILFPSCLYCKCLFLQASFITQIVMLY